MAALMALASLRIGARLRGGLRGEMMAGRVTARAASKVWSWVPRGAVGCGVGAAELGGAGGEG
jgi:hypothetical protein